MFVKNFISECLSIKIPQQRPWTQQIGVFVNTSFQFSQQTFGVITVERT